MHIFIKEGERKKLQTAAYMQHIYTLRRGVQLPVHKRRSLSGLPLTDGRCDQVGGEVLNVERVVLSSDTRIKHKRSML